MIFKYLYIKAKAHDQKSPRRLFAFLGPLFLSLFFIFLVVPSAFAAKDLDVKSNTQSFFYVNGTSGNVGVSTFAPNALLDVSSTVATDLLRVNDDGTGDGSPFLIKSDGNVGIGTMTPQGGLVVMNGNVGIGTWVPNRPLDVVGNVLATAIQVRSQDTAFDTNGEAAYIRFSDSIQTFKGAIGYFYRNGRGVPGVEISSADNMFLSTNGSTGSQLSILTSGNVGISTYLPEALFDISSTAAQDLFRVNDNSAGDTTPFLITSIGNVGVGSVAPGEKVDVQGTVRATAFSGDGSLITGITSAGGFTDGGTNVYTTTSTDNVGIGTSTPQGALVVTNGNVGIGTWAPRGVLEVIGALSTSPFIIDANGNVGIGTTSTSTSALTVMNGNVGIGSLVPGAPLSIRSVGATSKALQISPGNSASNAYWNIGTVYNYTDSDLVFSTNAGEKFRINSSGNLGLGTAFSVSNKLEVVGAVSIGSIASFAGTTAPTNGLIVEGNTGIGTTSPSGKLSVLGAMGVGSNAYVVNNTPPSAGLIVEGNVGIGTFNPFGGKLIIPTTNGNVGIGSLAPGTALDVTGTVRATAFSGDGSLITGITNAGGFTDGGANVYTTTGSDNVGIGTTTPQAGFVVTNGNVGVGTWTAEAPLTFAQTSTGEKIRFYSSYGMGISSFSLDVWADRLIKFRDSAYTGTVNAQLGVEAGQDSYLTAGNVGIGTFVPNALFDVSSTAAQDLFRVNDNGTADTSPFIIDSTGNVGIGTFVNNPTFPTKLTVAGAVTTSNSLIFATAISSNYEAIKDLDTPSTPHVNSNAIFVLLGDSTDSGYAGNTMIAPSAGLSAAGIYSSSNVGIGTFDVTGGQLIVTGGNVGIGSLTPGTTLDVTGTVRATAFSGDGSALTNVSNTSGFTDAGTEIYLTTVTDKVGLGTTTPQGAFVVTNGNVGIGTWAPASKLQVRGGSVTSEFGYYNGGTGNSYWNTSSSALSYLGLWDGGASYFKTIAFTNTGNVGLGSTAADTNPVVFIAGTRNVGIGTITPQSGFVVTNGNVGIGTWTASSTFDVVGSLGITTVSKSANYTATASDYAILVDATGGVTIALPAAASSKGRTYVIKKTDATAGALTIDPNAAETIDGATTYVITTQYQSVTIVCDGSNWWII